MTGDEVPLSSHKKTVSTVRSSTSTKKRSNRSSEGGNGEDGDGEGGEGDDEEGESTEGSDHVINYLSFENMESEVIVIMLSYYVLHLLYCVFRLH